uniref:Uncharacterized protein n=1 Tax=Panagrolaimus sp. JU765 TaxID=591449 RepID=A0AC34QZ27_9BILA
MPVEWSSLPLLSKDVEVKLFHRNQTGRKSVLRIEADAGIKKVDVSSLDGISEVPCEVIEGKKPKLRFNAELLEIGQTNETVQQLLKSTLLSMVEQFFAEWTVDAPVANDTRFAAFCELQTILIQQAPVIEVGADYRTAVTWKVTAAHLTKTGKKTKGAAMGKDSVFVMVRNVLPRQKPVKNILNSMAQLPVDPPSQVVDFMYCAKGIRKTLISLEFAGFPPLDDSLNHSLHRVEFNPTMKSICLDLFPKFGRSHYFWTIPHDFCVFGYTRWSKTNGTLVCVFEICI